MIEFRIDSNSFNSTLFKSVERAIASYPWAKPVTRYNKQMVSLLKFRARELGFKVRVTQRYNKTWYLRAIKFNTDAEYTMFQLKWARWNQ